MTNFKIVLAVKELRNKLYTLYPL